MAAGAAKFKNRIVGTGEADPSTLKANAKNWRRHPDEQRSALAGVLAQVGWVTGVIVNRSTGNMVDGHARVEQAIADGETSVPVVYVELTEPEERLVLATFDPLGAMAESDQTALDALLSEVATDDEGLAAMLQALSQEFGSAPPNVNFAEFNEDEGGKVQYAECPKCGHKFPK